MFSFAHLSTASRRLARPSASMLLVTLLGVQLAGACMPARAQSGSAAAMHALQFESLGETTFRRNSRAAWLLTLDQAATATAACGGNACASLGLDGTPITVAQDLHIIIDLVGAGVVALSGHTRGTLGAIVAGQPVTADFRGSVSGEGTCSDAGCSVRLTVVALTRDGASLRLDLNGTFVTTEQSAHWIALGGAGQIAVGPGIFRTH